ncbi:MAG: hypothetical protein FWE75_02070, partial [Actinomycetia bacterium]|nr:hypothetical protein [Actinomycetes bacterium]
MTTTDFSGYFRSLVAALGGQPGWYGAFAARRPGVARAYEAGAELPPWDVVHTVLHDAAAAQGGVPAPAEIARARSLHQAAIAIWDAAPGAEPALRARLDAAAREEDAAARREHQAAARVLSATPATESAARLATLHAWTRDDHRRAASRRAELHTRLLSLPTTNRPAGSSWSGPGAEPRSRMEPASGRDMAAWPAGAPGPGGGEGAQPARGPAGGSWAESGREPAKSVGSADEGVRPARGPAG